MLITALGTGLRRGEILGLKFTELDFVRGSILISHSKSGKPRVEVSHIMRKYAWFGHNLVTIPYIIDTLPIQSKPLFCLRTHALRASLREWPDLLSGFDDDEQLPYKAGHFYRQETRLTAKRGAKDRLHNEPFDGIICK
jgi:hypothetical protein